jgi:hypothetical protein
LWHVCLTTGGPHARARARLQPPTLSGKRDVYLRKRTSSRTHAHACPHAPHSFRILSASLSLHRRIYKCICRYCCTDTYLMVMSRQVCVRVCLCVRACSCNERVRVHGFVCVRASLSEVNAFVCVRARVCVRVRACVCRCTRACVSAHVRVHIVHFHRIASLRACVFDVCVSVWACVRARRGAVRALLLHGGDRWYL